MQSANRFAFKEWAVTCQALAAGRQSLLLRKGGIHERNGRFEVEHARVLALSHTISSKPGRDPRRVPALVAASGRGGSVARLGFSVALCGRRRSDRIDRRIAAVAIGRSADSRRAHACGTLPLPAPGFVRAPREDLPSGRGRLRSRRLRISRDAAPGSISSRTLTRPVSDRY